jgi:hypothetical protein
MLSDPDPIMIFFCPMSAGIIGRYFPPQLQKEPYVDWACAEMARHLELDPDLLCGMELETYVKTMAPYYLIAATTKSLQ